MLENRKCPNCGTEQVGLDLKETNGSFVCSKCERKFIVEGNTIREEINQSSKYKGSKK